jgi:transposase
MVVQAFTRRNPVRPPLPEHLPRERVVVPAPSACPCCGGKLTKLGETITESLEIHPAAVAGGADGAGEVHPPVLRDHHPAAGAAA